jgi:type III secretion protein C
LARVARLILLLVAMTMASSLTVDHSMLAATPNWPHEPYDYVTVDQDLSQVLKDFAANLGLTIQISPNIHGTVRGRLPSVPPAEFLETLARTYGLIWYYDGIILYVYALDEVQSKMIKLDSASIGALSSALSELDIEDPRFPWTVSEASGILYVAGPPRYVELVTETASMLDSSHQLRVDVRVFPLKYALADDRTFIVRDQQVTVPGVATIIARLVNAGESSSSIGTQRTSLGGASIRTVPTTMGAGPFSPAAIADNRIAELSVRGASPLPDVVSPYRSSDTEVEIQADPRLNAVLVKDYAARMPMYEQLIQSLDQPRKLVELEVVIADINSTRLQDLGVDWRLGFDSGSTNVNIGVGNPIAAAAGAGLNFATAITGDPFSFLSRIRALEQTGDARVLSRPTVMTFDNVEALFDQSQSFFVKLEGQDAVDLAQVDVGLLVKVTPHLITEGGRTRVQMIIDVEDGTSSPDETVDELPTIQKATLSTQGIVTQQQALVIGGFYREEQIDNLSKVPWLADIPIIGWTLFQNKTQNQSSVVRLFLIRPLVVDDQAELEPVVSRSLELNGLPRQLFPPSADLRYTPSGNVVLDGVRYGTLLQDQSNVRNYEALCLARAAMGAVCQPIPRPTFVLDRFESKDNQPPAQVPQPMSLPPQMPPPMPAPSMSRQPLSGDPVSPVPMQPAPGQAIPPTIALQPSDPRAPRPLY